MLQKKKSPLNFLRVLDKIRKEEDMLSSITNDFFHFHGFSPFEGMKNPNFSPSLDFVDKNDKYVVKIEIPGIKKEDIDIELDDNTLIVKGEKKDEYEETKNDIYVNERSYGAFRREIRLPGDCDINNIEANYKNGLLFSSSKNRTKRKRK